MRQRPCGQLTPFGKTFVIARGRRLPLGNHSISINGLKHQPLTELVGCITAPDTEVVPDQQSQHAIRVPVDAGSRVHKRKIASRPNGPARTPEPATEVVLFGVVVEIDWISADLDERAASDCRAAVD